LALSSSSSSRRRCSLWRSFYCASCALPSLRLEYRRGQSMPRAERRSPWRKARWTSASLYRRKEPGERAVAVRMWRFRTSCRGNPATHDVCQMGSFMR
jgi:hypothetical protein